MPQPAAQAPAVGPAPTMPAPLAAPRAAPRNAAELRALREQRDELFEQLKAAQQRRRDVAQALESARDPINQNGLQARLQVLDQRVVRVEGDLAELGRLLTGPAAQTIAAASPPPRFPLPAFDRGPSASVVVIVFTACVLLPLAMALARILTRRFGRAAPDPRAGEAAARLARLEQAVDAIAVEVERVSEGQRFVTRLLAEERGSPAPAQLAAPARTAEMAPGPAATG